MDVQHIIVQLYYGQVRIHSNILVYISKEEEAEATKLKVKIL